MKSRAKRQRIIGIILAVLLGAGSLVSQQAKKVSAKRLYAEALLKKNADGDLQGAIKLFTRVVSDYSSERSTAQPGSAPDWPLL